MVEFGRPDLAAPRAHSLALPAERLPGAVVPDPPSATGTLVFEFVGSTPWSVAELAAFEAGLHPHSFPVELFAAGALVLAAVVLLQVADVLPEFGPVGEQPC